MTIIKEGDQIVVHGIMPPAKVSKVWYSKDEARNVIELDWGGRGTSRVYDHDENKVWFKYKSVN